MHDSSKRCVSLTLSPVADLENLKGEEEGREGGREGRGGEEGEGGRKGE